MGAKKAPNKNTSSKKRAGTKPVITSVKMQSSTVKAKEPSIDEKIQFIDLID